MDLADPTQPIIAGSIEVPGWSSYIQPLGNRLITLGLETNRVVVSLFDVANPARAVLLSRVALGESYSWSEANYDEKALTVLQDAGLILVPYEGDTKDGYASRVQLIDLGSASLAARGVIEHRMAPRRAMVHQGKVISILAQHLLTVEITDRDHPLTKAETDLAWPVTRVFARGDYVVELSSSAGWTDGNRAFVRVAAAAQPEAVADRLDLGEWPVLGVALCDERLFLLQGPGGFYWPVSPSAPSAS